MRKPLFQVIAEQYYRYANAVNRADIAADAREKIDALVKEHMPSGSGFDSGTSFDYERSGAAKLVFVTHFHHMDDNGYYDGWTDHTVTVSASLIWDIEIRVGGRDRRDIKSYIYDVFRVALKKKVEDGTMLVSKEDEAISHLRALVPHVVETDAGQALAHARVFLNRQNGDFRE